MGTKLITISSGKFYPLICIGVLVLIVQGCGSLVHHRVEKGDTLYSIGFYYGHDYRDIAKWNGISAPYAINRGQWLIVTPPENSVLRESRKNYAAQKRVASNKKSLPNKNIKRPVVAKSNTAVADNFDYAKAVLKWQWPAIGTVQKSNRSLSVRKKGINIVGTYKQSIYATAAGKVVYSGNGLIGFGNLIIIKHNKTYLSAYGHNERILVKEGDVVHQGQKIALMGKAQDDLAQLHFEIRRNGTPVDPLHFLVRKSH